MKLKFNPLEDLRVALAAWLVSLLPVLGFLYGTSPDEIGPEGITVFFVVLYTSLVAAAHLIGLLVGRRLLSRSWRFSYAPVIAFVPVIAIGLQSLDQLALRDIVIFVSMVALGIFVIYRGGRAKP